MCSVQDKFRSRIKKHLYQENIDGLREIFNNPEFNPNHKTPNGTIAFDIINYRNPDAFEALISAKEIDLEARNMFGETLEDHAKSSRIRPIITSIEQYKLSHDI